ncbi:MAG: putative Ig domain-containing protein, partial [Thermoplasmata archaeon]
MKLKKIYAMLVMLMLVAAVVPAITMAGGIAGGENETKDDGETEITEVEDLPPEIEGKEIAKINENTGEKTEKDILDSRDEVKERQLTFPENNKPTDIEKEKREIQDMKEQGSEWIKPKTIDPAEGRSESDWKTKDIITSEDPRKSRVSRLDLEIEKKTDLDMNEEDHSIMGTNVSGLISGNVWWNYSDSPIWVEGDITVTGNLTIGAGVRVLVNGSYAIDVGGGGSLAINGMPGNMTYLISNATTPAAGDWQGIYFDPTANEGMCSIRYANISHTTAGLELYGVTFPIRYSNFTVNDYGIWATEIDISDCNITHNVNSGIYITDVTGYFYIHDSLIGYNSDGIDIDQVFFYGGSFDWLLDIDGNDFMYNSDFGILMFYIAFDAVGDVNVNSTIEINNNHFIGQGQAGIYFLPVAFTDNGFRAKLYHNLSMEYNVFALNGYGILFLSSPGYGPGLALAHAQDGPAHVYVERNLSNNTIVSNYYSGILMEDWSLGLGGNATIDRVFNFVDNDVSGNGMAGSADGMYLNHVDYATALYAADSTVMNIERNNFSDNPGIGYGYITQSVAFGGDVIYDNTYTIESNEAYNNADDGIWNVFVGQQDTGFNFTMDVDAYAHDNTVVNNGWGISFWDYVYQDAGGLSYNNVTVETWENTYINNTEATLGSGLELYSYSDVSDPGTAFADLYGYIHDEYAARNQIAGIEIAAEGDHASLYAEIEDCDLEENTPFGLYLNWHHFNNIRPLYLHVDIYDSNFTDNDMYGIYTEMNTTADWYIDDYGEAHNNDVYLRGNVTVLNTGKHSLRNLTMECWDVDVDGLQEVVNAPNSVISSNLTIAGTQWLNSSEWRMNCSYDGEYRIEVTPTGHMMMQDIGTGPSNITRHQNSAYEFWVQDYGILEIYDSNVRYCGWQDMSDDLMHSGLWINSDSVTLNRAVVEYGFAGAVVYEKSPFIENSTFRYNNFTGILSSDTPSLTLRNDTAIHNGDPTLTSTVGVYIENSAVDIYESNVSNNGGSQAGAGVYSFNSTVTAMNTDINWNSGTVEGEGFIAFDTMLDLSMCNITWNGQTSSLGAGVWMEDSSTATISNSNISYNGDGSGGASFGIQLTDSELDISDSDVNWNGVNGATAFGIFADTSNITVSGNNIMSNGLYASSDAYGILMDNVNFDIYDNEILSNGRYIPLSGWFGDGIDAYDSNGTVIENNITLNGAETFGAWGIYTENSEIDILNNDINRNGENAIIAWGVYLDDCISDTHNNTVERTGALDNCVQAIAMWFSGGTTVDFYNNTVLDNGENPNPFGQPDFGIGVYVDSAQAEIYENEVSSNGDNTDQAVGIWLVNGAVANVTDNTVNYNGEFAAVAGVGIMISVSYVTVDGNTVDYNGFNTMGGGYGLYIVDSDPLVTYNEISYNGGEGIYWESSGDINATIHDNHINWNLIDGIFLNANNNVNIQNHNIYVNEITNNTFGDGIFAVANNGWIMLNFTGNNNSIEYNGLDGIDLIALDYIEMEVTQDLRYNSNNGITAQTIFGDISGNITNCNIDGNLNNGIGIISGAHVDLNIDNMFVEYNGYRGVDISATTNYTGSITNSQINYNSDDGLRIITHNDYLDVDIDMCTVSNNSDTGGDNLYLNSSHNLTADIMNSHFDHADAGDGIETNSWINTDLYIYQVTANENAEMGMRLFANETMTLDISYTDTNYNGMDGVNMVAEYGNHGRIVGSIDHLTSNDNGGHGLMMETYYVGSSISDRFEINDSTFGLNSRQGISVSPNFLSYLDLYNLYIHNNTEDGIFVHSWDMRLDLSESILSHNDRGVFLVTDDDLWEGDFYMNSILYSDQEGILIDSNDRTYPYLDDNVIRDNSQVSGHNVDITSGGYLNADILSNQINDAGNGDGLRIHGDYLVVLEMASNTIRGNDQWGAHIYGDTYVNVDLDMNEIYNNNDGLYLESPGYVYGYSWDDQVHNNSMNGVEVYNANGLWFNHIIVNDNGNNGLELHDSQYTHIQQQSEFMNNYYNGISMWNSMYVWVESSEVYGNYLGVYLNRSTDVLIGNNTITYNLGSASDGDGGGIWAEDYSDMTLMNNEISFNMMYGVYTGENSDSSWYVDSTVEAKSNIILLQGDIEVWNGGSLLLKDISGTYPSGLDLGVYIRSDRNNEHHVAVNAGGNLDVMNSLISSYSMDSYEFVVDGDMLMNGATVEMVYRIELYSSNVDIVGSTVKDGWYGGIAVYGSSPTIERTQIMDNTYYGLYLNNSVPTIEELEISGNRDGILLDQTTINFYNLELMGNDNGIKAMQTSQFNIYNSTLDNTANDFYLEGGSTGWLLNTDFDKTATTVLDTSYLDVNWFAHVKVEDHNGNAFSEAPVDIYDSTGTPVASGTTDTMGMAKWFVLQEYREDSAGMTYYTPHNFTATVMSSTWYTHENMDETKTVTISGNNMPYITSTAPTTVDEDAEYYYNVDATDPNGDGLTFSLTDRPTGMTIDASTGEISWTPVDEDVGDHSVTVRVIDGYGGWDEQSWTLTVVNTNDAPVITSTPITNAVEDSMYQYNVSAEDDDLDSGDMLSYSLDVAPVGMMIEDNGLITWLPTNDDVGDNTVVVRVEDTSSEYDTQTFVITVQNVNDAPTITSAPPTTAMEDHDYTYDVQAEDVDGDDLTYSLSDRPTGMMIDSTTGMITWTPTNDQVGLNDVTVRVQDGNGGSATQSWQINVTNVNDAPMITSSAPTTAIEDMEYSYPVAAVDIDGDSLSYSLLVAPEEMNIDGSGEITWTPVNDDVGDHTVMIEVSDGNNGTDTQTFIITVQNTNDAPTITSEAGTSAVEDEEYVYDVNAKDVDGDDLHYSLSEKPTGMTIDSSNGMITWVPTNDQVGSHSVSVMVSDGNGGTDNQSWDISVSNVNDKPVITSTPVLTAVEDCAYSYTVKATDIDGDSLTYNLDVAPSGMVIGSDGTITWTPTNDHVGTHSVMVSVDDGTEEVVQTFQVTVQNVNDAPTIVSEPVTSASEDEDYVYDVDGEDIDGDELTYSLTQKPTGMTIDSSTGMISWTPTNDQTEEFDVTVKVSDGNGGTAEQAFTVTVGNVNDDPILSGASISPRDGTSEDKYEFTVT